MCHGLVNASGPGGERGLEQISAVGGQQEDDVGILVEPVHLVEKGEEQWRLSAVVAALLGDQVDVLDDDHGRLERAGDGTGFADAVQGLPSEFHDGRPDQLTDQVAHRMGLAHARRAVEEDAALEVLARGPQPRAVAGHPDDLAAQVVDTVAAGRISSSGRHGGAFAEAEQRSPARRTCFARTTPPGRGRHCARVRAPEGGRPNSSANGARLAMISRVTSDEPLSGSGPRKSTAMRSLAVLEQDDASTQALTSLAAWTAGQTDPGDVARPRAMHRVHGVVTEQMGDPERAVMAVPGHPQDPRAVVVLVEYAVQGTLHVHVLVRRPLLHRHGEARPRRPPRDAR